MKSIRELCLAPGSGESFSPERLRRVEEALIEDRRSEMPWYLRAIVGVGAWLASLFFLGFALTLLGWDDEHPKTIGISGVVLLILAVAIGRQAWGIFVEQCALAVSLAAQAMIYYGFLDENHHPLATTAIFSIILAVVLYVAYPVLLSRLMTCFVALQVSLFWIYAGNSDDPFDSPEHVQPALFQFLFFYWVFQLAAICLCFLKPRRSIYLAPLGYALVTSIAAWQLENLFNVWVPWSGINHDDVWMVLALFRLRMVLVALTLFGVATWAAGGLSILREKAPLFIGLALALTALVCFGLGGVLLALLLTLIGFSLQNRPVLGLGLILFAIFLTTYYYTLSLDLLAKSVVLIGSGVLMLLLRTGLARWVFADVKEAA